ncbi:MAG: helix-turn-helix domain-containing protein [Candidatus Helarchaeota archaeon]
MNIHRAVKIRVYPTRGQRALLDQTFGCCRFINNKMLEERIRVYKELIEDKDSLYAYKYKTEREYKVQFPFLKVVDAKALQSE